MNNETFWTAVGIRFKLEDGLAAIKKKNCQTKKLYQKSQRLAIALLALLVMLTAIELQHIAKSQDVSHQDRVGLTRLIDSFSF